MYPSVEISDFIAELISIGDSFDKLHNKDNVSLDDLNIDLVLPYIVLHAKDHPQLINKIQKKYGYRISFIVELFNASIDPNEEIIIPPPSFDNLSPNTKLLYLRNDLKRLEKGGVPLIFSVRLYWPYIRDVFPVLYHLLNHEFSFEIFKQALLNLNEETILTTCFCFPNFIIPIFTTKFDLSQVGNIYASALSAKLAVMCTLYRPILIPKFFTNHIVFAYLAVHYFGTEAPEMLINALGCDFYHLRHVTDQLDKMQLDTNAYYLCIARGCACDRAIQITDVAPLLRCKDTRLLASLFFSCSSYPSELFDQIIARFKRDKESFIELMTFFSEVKRPQNFTQLWVADSLGNTFHAEKNRFFDAVFAHVSNVRILNEMIGDSPQLLGFLGAVINEITVFTMRGLVSKAMAQLQTVTAADTDSISRFLNMIYECEKTPECKAEVAKSIIEENDFFDQSNIRSNPAPAVAATIMVCFSNPSATGKQLLQKIPLRLIMAAAEKFPVQISVCHLIKTVCPKIAREAPQFSLSIEDIHPKVSPSECLKEIQSRIENSNKSEKSEEVDLELYNEWKIHHFSESFEFALQTLGILGAPRKFLYPHFAFQLPKLILRNQFLLRILLSCVLDCIDQEERPVEESRLILAHDAVNTFSDSFVDGSAIGDFLGSLFDNDTFARRFIDRTFELSLVNTFCKYVPLNQALFVALKGAITNSTLKRLSFPTFLTAGFAVSGNVMASTLSELIHKRVVQLEEEGVPTIFDFVNLKTLSKALVDLAIAVPSQSFALSSAIEAAVRVFQRNGKLTRSQEAVISKERDRMLHGVYDIM